MKTIKRFGLVVLVFLIVYVIYWSWISLPIATGYGAKVLCSAVFISGRNDAEVISNDLDFIPLRYVHFEVNHLDSTVTASILGVARKTAIYRDGFGATLINDITERELRSQRGYFREPVPPGLDTIAFPAGERVDRIPAGIIDSAMLHVAVDELFKNDREEGKNETRALVVLYDGKIIAEKYCDGFDRSTRLTAWSMTKSITGALIGIMAQKNLINIDAPAPVAEWRVASDARQLITTRHLLQQTSGLKFDEVYDRASDANSMLFLRGDAAAFAASKKIVHQPGEVFSYSSGNSNILSQICRTTLGDSLYYEFPYRELFDKTGMYSAVLECDASGTYVGSSFCYATARDFARFGLLFLDSGKFNGTQVISPSWIIESLQPADATQQGEYGFQWWLNKGKENDAGTRLYPNLPVDMYFADGYEGQNIFIIPSEKLVIVRLGLTRKKSWGEAKFISTVISSIRR